MCCWLDKISNYNKNICVSDGVVADADMRRHLGQEGLKRVTDVRLDDLFIFTDGDEIPKFEVLLFLKLHDGIPQLVGLHNIWAIFGFFWQVDPLIYGGGIHYTNSVLTVQFFRDFYQYDASRVRTNDFLKESLNIQFTFLIDFLFSYFWPLSDVQTC